MEYLEVDIEWPDGQHSVAYPGQSWLEIAHAAGFTIPTGCLGGSCGACEIEVNGETIRACISAVPKEYPIPRSILHQYARSPSL